MTGIKIVCSREAVNAPLSGMSDGWARVAPARLRRNRRWRFRDLWPKLCAMKYRRFGRTELAMPVLSCGGMRYQFKWQDVEPNEIPPDNQANLEAAVHRALELGINHIETARGYGTSEMQLGHILPKLPREKMVVQTKVAPKPKAKDFL